MAEVVDAHDVLDEFRRHEPHGQRVGGLVETRAAVDPGLRVLDHTQAVAYVMHLIRPHFHQVEPELAVPRALGERYLFLRERDQDRLRAWMLNTHRSGCHAAGEEHGEERERRSRIVG